MRFSDGSYLEDQDHWWLSGIHRHAPAHQLADVAGLHGMACMSFNKGCTGQIYAAATMALIVLPSQCRCMRRVGMQGRLTSCKASCSAEVAGLVSHSQPF